MELVRSYKQPSGLADTMKVNRFCSEMSLFSLYHNSPCAMWYRDCGSVAVPCMSTATMQEACFFIWDSDYHLLSGQIMQFVFT